MSGYQLEMVQHKLRVLRMMIAGMGSYGIHGPLDGGDLKRVLEIMAEIDVVLQDNIAKNSGKTDEEVVKCAEALYARARKGFFTRNESIEYLNDSIVALENLLLRTDRMKRKAEKTKKTSLQFLNFIKRGAHFSTRVGPSRTQ